MNLVVEESPILESPRAVDPTRMPQHIAIIMDGNRRWAKANGVPRVMGHWRGMETLIRIVAAASDLGVKVLTVYAFSSENRSRSSEEVHELMEVFEKSLEMQEEPMIRKGVKLEAIGNLVDLPESLQKRIEITRKATAGGQKIQLVLALNYGGRDDIKRATVSLVGDCLAGKIQKEEITEYLISRYLDTAKWNDPDLLIRTSGEKRVSNFLLWQISYTELYTTEVLWPDFTEKGLIEAIADYQQRHKRSGR
jgi:undecaprenyl diphosphate synthase